jgi:hypothetical protein
VDSLLIWPPVIPHPMVIVKAFVLLAAIGIWVWFFVGHAPSLIKLWPTNKRISLPYALVAVAYAWVALLIFLEPNAATDGADGGGESPLSAVAAIISAMAAVAAAIAAAVANRNAESANRNAENANAVFQEQLELQKESKFRAWYTTSYGNQVAIQNYGASNILIARVELVFPWRGRPDGIVIHIGHDEPPLANVERNSFRLIRLNRGFQHQLGEKQAMGITGFSLRVCDIMETCVPTEPQTFKWKYPVPSPNMRYVCRPRVESGDGTTRAENV